MIGQWMAAHRSLVATATSGTVIAAVVATLAVVSTGFTAQKVDLGDGSVWVGNNSSQVIGRANPQVLELNTVVRSTGAELSVVQSTAEVLLVDHTDATVSIVNPATSTTGESIALPPQQPEVFLAGDRAVIYAAGTGELWLVPLAQLQSFDATTPSTLSLGEGTVVRVSPEGTLVAYSPGLGEVYRLDASSSDQVEQRWKVDLGAASDQVQITAVGSQWAVLDVTTRKLATDGHISDLSGVIASGASPVLQQAGPASSRVLLSTRSGLYGIPFDGGQAERLVDGRSGSAAAPVVLGSCQYAAWTSGTAWRHCAGEASTGTVLRLDSMPGGAQLTFAANGRQLVLNDARSGATWAVQQRGELIDNWDQLIPKDDSQQAQQNNQDVPPTVDPQQKPPVAVDDQLGARPGKATMLPVLLNDYDPNGDVLVITQVDTIDETIGHIDIVARNQELQITLGPTASGVISFGYTISDGRGGTASATVHLTVRTPDENSAPQQVRVTKTTVAGGGRVSTQVIGDWIDPDGDPFFLSSATTSGTDHLSYQPDGVVVFSDSGDGGLQKSVTLTMSDGRAEGNGSLAVTVKPQGQVPIVIEPWVALATAGETITISPMSHVRGGNGPLRLNAVPAKAGTTIVPSFDAGTFTFTSEVVGTHYVDITITDGQQTQTGLVRVDVSAPPSAGTRPITVPQTIFVSTLGSNTIDPTQTDIDPAGGVLVVTGLLDVPPNSGVEAEILDQHQVRVTLSKPLQGANVVFNYRISNGLADAVGTITVVEIPRPAQLQPPVATDDSVTVRVGDAIDIPVLANDQQPDGQPIQLLPRLAQPLPSGAGLLFVSGDRLSYLAPSTAGNYSAVYSIAGPDGQTAQARVSISVREVDPATNNPPVPQQVTARVLAGETVSIPIPLAGIDPDGDSVQLIGVGSNPEKGSVLSVANGSIVYQAGDYSSGTDSFSYTVVDGLGARATGTVRVGISARLGGARNPVANADSVEVRPGRTVSVQVLANDSDPDGSPLTVTAVAPNTPGTKATIVDKTIVDITPPKSPGTYSVIYTIQNEYGGTSSNFVTVKVDPNAPLAYPVVNDTTLSVTDVIGRDSVDVAVLDNVFFADGSVNSLGVALLQGYSGSAQVLADKKIRVQIGNKSQIIPFSVSHPDDDSVKSYGFIRVPGYDDALPQVNLKAPQLRVKSEQPLTIDLNQYVVALGGSRVHLTDTASVKATHANGDPLVVDDHTLKYTSADRYFGPASITFEVTDAGSAGDPSAHTAILTLAIDVQPRDNQPPSFIGGVVDFEPGQQKELDLVRLTNYPYPDVNELSYTVLAPDPPGFSYTLNGQRLELTASDGAQKGSTTSISIGVRDAVNNGLAGTIQLQVVPSTRPLAKPVPDTAVARRGQTTTVDVLSNDQANNPFPGTPLRVIDIRGIDGASLPDGVTVAPSADKSQVSVTVNGTAAPADVNIQYEVADATGDPDRYVWGNATVSIQDVPDPVTNFRVTEFGDRYLKLSWVPGQFNNSPITEYDVTMTTASSGAVLSTTACTTTVGCQITTPGNGPSNAVRFSVVAVNAIGPSSAQTAGPIWSDVIPPPPAGLTSRPLDHGLRVGWKKPADTGGGSPIEQYVVVVGGITQFVSVSSSDPVGTQYWINTTSGSIANGAAVGFSVSARNSAPNSLATWNESDGTGVPAGVPIVAGSPSATGSTTDGTTASVSWPGAFSDNGAGITDYYVALYTGSAPSCTVTGVESGSPVLSAPSGPGVQHLGGGASSTSYSGLSANQTYSITVYAYNGQGCTASPSVQVTPRAAPGTVTGITASGPASSGTGTWDYSIAGLAIGSGSTAYSGYQYRYVSGAEGSEHGYVTTGSALLTTDGSQYGNAVSVEVKACNAYPGGVVLCSADWSAPFSLGTPVDNSVPGGLTATSTGPLGGDWTWGSSPSGSYDSLQYSCDGGATWTDLAFGAGGSCHTLGVPQPADLQIRIQADGVSGGFVRSYSWTDFN
ncbi:Ig-like domain-containing protein [Lysinimonas soli]|uniref:Ig-like domain-containing protein n=1 Tax=Lysinimonas soli TaxID=1074233 RepID=A0ABW0NNL1_9MICO